MVQELLLVTFDLRIMWASIVVACGFSCSRACGISFPDKGLNLHLLHCEVGT